MTFMGKGVLNLFIALGLLTWVRTARMIRGSVMQLKEKEVHRGQSCQRCYDLLDHYKGTYTQLPFHHYSTCDPGNPQCHNVRGVFELFGNRYSAADALLGKYDQCGPDIYQLPSSLQHYAGRGYNDNSYRIQYLRRRLERRSGSEAEKLKGGI